jgi:glycosyltransferase involved in cell wall biosynthesis
MRRLRRTLMPCHAYGPGHAGCAIIIITIQKWGRMQVLIDGEPYVKQTEQKTYTIGIGITTHNRHTLWPTTVAKIIENTPGAKVVVVDDASKVAVRMAGVEMYRFNDNVGIARAKNKCLELLSDCEHIFLFDDDTHPLAPGWHEPYVNSPEHHLMYLFDKWANGRPVGDDAILYSGNGHRAHAHARGCMMYIDNVALATVGGLDTRFGKAMNEHLDWSLRIHNAGLTTFPYMDVAGSDQLIHSMDQHQAVTTSIDNRHQLNMDNKHLLDTSNTSTEYIPYGKDLVIACYFAGVADVQRNGTKWDADLGNIEKLRRSVERQGLEFVLIHNCFDLPNRVEISSSPYFERWLHEWRYLRDRRDVNNVFVVDATDVDLVNNPFPHLKPGTLYIGDENATLANPWLITKHLEPTVNDYLRRNADKQLLNCGVVGGSRKLVMAVCRDIYQYHFEKPQDQTEMGVFNYLMHRQICGPHRIRPARD